MAYVTQVCWLLSCTAYSTACELSANPSASRIRTELVPSWPRLQAVSNTGITCTTAVCTVENSWWWAEELSETCRVSFKKLIWEIGAYSWFYYKNFITTFAIALSIFDILFSQTQFIDLHIEFLYIILWQGKLIVFFLLIK